MPRDYTPGPWRVVHRSGEYWIAAGTSDYNEVASPADQDSLATLAGNAKIIALSPQMYELLLGLFDYVEDSGRLVIDKGGTVHQAMAALLAKMEE